MREPSDSWITGQGSSGELVKVAYAKDPVEVGLIQGLLENEGIPSVVREIGLHGPGLGIEMLGTSPGQVMVRGEDAERARKVLAETFVEQEDPVVPDTFDADAIGSGGVRKPRSYGVVGAYARSYLWALGVLIVAFAIFWISRNI